MHFRTEKDLQAELVGLDFGLLRQFPVCFTRREVHVGGCIPDLVSVHFDHDPKHRPWPKRWSYRHSFTVSLLREWHELRIDAIATLCYAETSAIVPVVDNLREWDIVVEKETGEFMLSEQFLKVRATVVAVEAKLRNWRDALEQAKRYRDFAELVAVAMDADCAPTDPQILRLFRRQQVGLCAISPGKLEWIQKPVLMPWRTGDEKQHLVMSTVLPSGQTLWKRRNLQKASSQA